VIAVLIGVVMASLVGWLAGMLTFKRSMAWCTECGETLGCLHCARRSVSPSRNAGPHRTTVSGS
jgi:Ser/Thr protein kinase RdoA (MazF antagonist)